MSANQYDAIVIGGNRTVDGGRQTMVNGLRSIVGLMEIAL
jgi:hypothetical protein